MVLKKGQDGVVITREVVDDYSDYTFCEQLKADVSFRGRVIHTAWLSWTFIGLVSRSFFLFISILI